MYDPEPTRATGFLLWVITEEIRFWSREHATIASWFRLRSVGQRFELFIILSAHGLSDDIKPSDECFAVTPATSGDGLGNRETLCLLFTAEDGYFVKDVLYLRRYREVFMCDYLFRECFVSH